MQAAVILTFMLGAAAAFTPPGTLFDLTNYKLQLPVSAGGSSVEQISQPALKTYNSTFFYALGGSSAYFFTPENGATTSGSSYPRSELRENIDWVLGTPGVHVLNATVRVLDDGPSHAVTIGQLHGNGLSGACSIIIELIWEAGDIVSHVRDQACKGKKLVVGHFALNETISFSLRAEGTSVSAATNDASIKPGAGDWQYPWFAGKKYSVYFKAGNYYQGSGPSSKGSLTALDALATVHP